MRLRTRFSVASTERLSLLLRTPGPQAAKKLKGYKDIWRIRIGDYRVVYIIDDATKLVSITRVAHRREVYE
jgi:mRNA interferase RelE/StbE